MFLKELFEDRNDDLTKVNWPPKTGEDAYQSGDVYKQRTRKDESKPTSVVPLLQNWVERNNATGEGAQILYALVKHLESSDPGIVEKVLNFIKGSEGMDEGLAMEPRGKPYVGGVTDVEKDAGAGKPTNQGQTDVEKGTMADVDRTNMPVQIPSRKKPIKSSGRDE